MTPKTPMVPLPVFPLAKFAIVVAKEGWLFSAQNAPPAAITLPIRVTIRNRHCIISQGLICTPTAR